MLASGKPLRELLPNLCDDLLASFDANAVALVLRGPSGYRTAYRTGEKAGLGAVEGAATHAVASGRPLREPGIIAATMPFASNALGGIALARTGADFDDEDLLTLETWAAVLSMRVHQLSIEEENKRLGQIAEGDQLTGIMNRGTFDARSRVEWNLAREFGNSVAVVIIDIDYFKPYNDRYGHLAGDTTLRRVAQALQACLHRPRDLVARFGGEEFVVLLPDTDEAAAVAVAERMRTTVIELGITHEESALGVVTISAGVASTVPRELTEVGELLGEADSALYRAKSVGRNHVAGSVYLSPSAPATRSAAASHNLPPVRSAFVGREGELQTLGDALARSRLVTIVGPGGAGKTRLAVQGSFAQIPGFRDGAWYVDVSAARDAADVFAKIAAALGIEHDVEVAAALFERLHVRRLLLVLDGCEHCTAAAGDVVDQLLRRTEHLRVLAVSRECLGVPGESPLRLRGLQPDEAVRLFSELAAAHASGVRDEARIRALCKQVDCLPLGIELLAAQSELAPPAPLHSLDEVIAWSVALLDERQRGIFNLLSVFDGGFSADAAATIASAEAGDIEALEAKSLLIAEHRDGVRYAMLDTMRSFASRSVPAPELDSLRERHFAYYRDLARNDDYEQFERERENYAVALDYAASARSHEDILALVAALVPFWLRHGHLREAARWLHRALERPIETEGPEVAQAFRYAGMVCRLLGDFVPARAYNESALRIWRKLDNAEGIGSALNGLALIAHTLGEFDRAQSLYEESLEYSERRNDALGVAMAVNNLGGLASFRGDYAEADRRMRDAMARAAALKDPSLEALVTNNLAEVRFLEERYDEALELAHRSLDIRLELRHRPGLAASWLLLANTQLSSGEDGEAWRSARESLLLYRDIGDRRGLAMALLTSARLLATRRRDEDAARLVRRADALIERSGAPLFGAERAIREMLGVTGSLPVVDAPADFETAFEDALATFR
jgi:diguanylate cyclase (GGDEF)-like protein